MDKKLIMAQTSGGLDIFHRLIDGLSPNPSKKTPFKSVFRDEKTASSYVYKKIKGPNKDDYHYYDFGDADSLDAIAFIGKLYGLDYKEASKRALDFANLSPVLYAKAPAYPEVVVRVAPGMAYRVKSIHTTPLHEAFRNLIPDNHSFKWGIGTFQIKSDSFTAFVYQNIDGDATQIKWCEYNPDGKRRKIITPKNFVEKQKGESPNIIKEVFEFCLFGEHLLPTKPDALVCVVESEKTAWIADYVYPDMAWLATGGQSKMREADVLRTKLNDGRPVIVLCDADPIRKIPHAYTILKSLGANVRLVDLYSDRFDKSDVADYILEGLKPEINFPDSDPIWALGAKPLEIKSPAEDVAPASDEEGRIVRFWSQDKKIELVPSLFIRFLEQEKFRKLITPEGKAQYIHIDGKFIDESFPLEIKNFVENYVGRPEFGSRPLDFILSNPQWFRDEHLNSITTATPKIQEDTTKDSYVYYKNCVVHVNKSGVEVVPYDDMDGLVWRSRILERQFSKQNYTGCVFERFLRLATGTNPIAYDSMRTIIGFMLHTHKNSATSRVVIFNDETISEKSKGGSGKGIVCESVSHIRETVMIDGKTHDMQGSFPFQLVKKSTQFVMFDDVEKTFNFSKLFSVVTGGITLEYKNKQAFRLTVEESPNIAICTNHTLGGDDDSNNRRRIEVELSDHFNEHYTPFTEFGHFLFSEWDDVEWLKFDNFMMDCLYLYFQKGCLPYPFKNLDYKKFIKETSSEFTEWVEDNPFVVNKSYKTNEVLAEFLKEYPDQAKYVNTKRMAGWMTTHAGKIGCRLDNIKFNGVRSRVFVPVATPEAVTKPLNGHHVPQFEPTLEPDNQELPF